MNALPLRLRTLVGITARIALVVMTLQIVAFDHHFSVKDVVGVEGSSAHTMHCHGDTAGCADAASGAVLAVEDAFALPRETTRPLELVSNSSKPPTVSADPDVRPPQL
ncbi:MAG TPA: hypothetical protein VG845_14090 [Dehalococcoidia bacterium]|nr:hypothetical protein [Dehalococcoidia bacterium]